MRSILSVRTQLTYRRFTHAIVNHAADEGIMRFDFRADGIDFRGGTGGEGGGNLSAHFWILPARIGQLAGFRIVFRCRNHQMRIKIGLIR